MNDHDLIQLHDEIRNFRAAVEESFTEVKGALAELKASSRVLDTLLERYLLERLDRIEKYLKLPPYVPHDTEQAA
jgi:hypothetical protein